MIRIAMMVLKLFLKVPYYLYKINKSGKKEPFDLENGFTWCKYATIKANKAGKVKIESSGLENLPKDNGFVLSPNHQGLYDVLAFLESCPVPFSFIITPGRRIFNDRGYEICFAILYHLDQGDDSHDVSLAQFATTMHPFSRYSANFSSS